MNDGLSVFYTIECPPPWSLVLAILPQGLVAVTVSGQTASMRARLSMPVLFFIPVVMSHSPQSWKSYLHSPAGGRREEVNQQTGNSFSSLSPSLPFTLQLSFSLSPPFLCISPSLCVALLSYVSLSPLSGHHGELHNFSPCSVYCLPLPTLHTGRQ